MAVRRYFLVNFNYVEPKTASNWPFRDCLGDTIASYIDYCEVAQKTGSKLVHQNNPADTSPPLSHVQHQNSQS